MADNLKINIELIAAGSGIGTIVGTLPISLRYALNTGNILLGVLKK